MSADFFYDTHYRNGHGSCAYEYNRLDPENKVDYSGWYHPTMRDAGIINAVGQSYIDRYLAVRGPMQGKMVGVEIDCGSSIPALFVAISPNNPELSQQTIDDMARILECDAQISMPPTWPGLRYEEVGIMPGRGFKLFRFMARGTHAAMRELADAHGCVNTEILTRTSEIPMNNSALSFDWDGISMTNFTFYSPNIGLNDRWVAGVTEHAHRKIAGVYLGVPHRVIRHVKIGLSPTWPAGYMKAYFTVREQPRV